MRKAINDNQVVQVALVGILLVVAGFLFMTRIAGGGEEAAPPATTATPAAGSAPEPSGSASASAPSATSPSDGAAASAPEAGTSVAPAAGASAGEFAAGPGLPKPVAAAYESGKTIVLLVVRGNGIDDRKVASEVRSRSGLGDTAVFVTRAKGIADYSRIASGVDVDRVPALVVIQPKRLAEGELPAATVSYGYRGPETIVQAVRDAGYKGRDNLPYYPN